MVLKIGCRADDNDKHDSDVNNLLFLKGKLYSAGDDGVIKVWAPDLVKLAEIQAHPCSVYSLTASEDTLFSCSNDGTVKSFDLETLKEKETLITEEDEVEFWRVKYVDGHLYAGDSEGNIRVWKNGTFYGIFSVAEPVKDMTVSGHILFTVKDVDVVITDVKLEGEKIQYGVKTNFMGRSPITLVGDKLFTFSSRDGKDIIIHENSDASHYKAVTKVQGAHEMLINTLEGAIWDGKTSIFSGGWDKVLKKWNVDEDIVKLDTSLKMDIVINSITVGEKGEIYVAGGDGHIVRVQDIV